MRRTAALLVVSLLPLACSGSGSSGARPEPASGVAPDEPERAAAVELVADDLVAYPRADFQGDDEPRCVAEAIVDGVGLDRLREVGLDVDAGTPPRLWEPELTTDEGDLVYAAYDDCLDFRRRDIEGFTAEGLTDAQAACVSDGYRASGVPRAHGLERPHAGAPTRVEAHTHLEEFLEATKAACRDWIRG